MFKAVHGFCIFIVIASFIAVAVFPGLQISQLIPALNHDVVLSVFLAIGVPAIVSAVMVPALFAGTLFLKLKRFNSTKFK